MMKNKQFKGEFGYKLLTPIMRILFRIYYNPKIINKEAIPKNGPILIVGNHKHIYDQCLTIMATKRPIHYMAKKEYFEGKLAWFFKFVGCICVNRNGNDKVAKNYAIDILKNNGAIGLFPEGTEIRLVNCYYLLNSVPFQWLKKQMPLLFLLVLLVIINSEVKT